MTDPVNILTEAGIKPTSNRLLVLRTLLDAPSPLSLIELETELETVERSSILRVLTLFLDRNLVHNLEDGRGIEKYEICHGDKHCSVDDMHPHFYCECCNKVYCFEELNIPDLPLPADFKVRTINFMLKGVCPDCRKSPHTI
ncbi:MAG: transcriptional repressor [Muribaculaceae bacterium]|nr:transcriptional repressor [Bacteroides sp.]MDE6681607.1 transcriptional repressor [Muribaculaceae bacterium]MDE6844048.1 transcriptional repressor [Muribaculaceae bacterium]